MSWTTVAISEVAKVVSGGTPKSNVPDYWDGGVPWVTPKDLSDLGSKTISATPRTITELGLNKSSAALLPPNSVLFSSRAPIGHVAINTVPMATNQGFKSFVPSERIDASYLYWFLRCHRRQLEALGNGATFKEVSKSVVERIELPLPPPEEQKRIAAILDQADALRRLRQRAIDRIDTLAQSIFFEMFGGDRSTSTLAALGEIADFVSGSTPSKDNPNYWTGTLPWVTPKDMKRRVIKDSIDHVSDDVVRSGKLKLIPCGTPLIVVRGMILAHTVPIATTAEDVTINQDMKAIRVDPSSAIPEFVSWALQAKHNHLLGVVSTAAHGTKRIDMRELKSFKIPLPTMDEQRKFLNAVSSVQELRTQANESFVQESKLFASLQHRAFRGDL